MAEQQPLYRVLVHSPKEADRLSAPTPDEWWREHGPIPASNGDAAIDKLREMMPELKADKAAEFVAIAETRFRRRRMRRQLVEKWALDDANVPDDEAPAQGTLTEAGVS